MFLRFLKTNSLFLLLSIPLFAGIFWFKSFISPAANVFSESLPTPLFKIIVEKLNSIQFPLLNNIFAFTLLMFQAFLIVKIDLKFSIISQKGYFTGFLYVLLSSSFGVINQLHSGLLAQTFFLLALHRIFSIYNTDLTFSKIFDASFWVSVASLFLFNSIFFAIFLFFCIIFLKSFNWRDWLILILGLFIPYFLFFILFFLFTGKIFEFFEILKSQIKFTNVISNVDLSKFIFIYIWLVLVSLLSFYYFVKKYHKMLISNKLYFNLLIILYLFVLGIYFFIPSSSIEILPFAYISFSYFFAFYFFVEKSVRFTEFLFWIFIAVNIYFQFF